MVLIGMAKAGAFTVDGLNYSVSNGVATLTGATSRTITSLSIPATVTSGGKTYPVRYITYNAFQNYSSLRSVRIEDSETPLGCQPYQYGGQIFYYSSFANCPVEEFYIGRDIVRRVSGGFAIDFVVLGSSSSNVDIAFGGGATYVPTKFAMYQSLKATQITGLTIGGAIDEFGKEIFSEAVNLKTLTLNPGEYSIQASMFPEGHVFETLNLEKTFTSQLPLDAVHVTFGEAWTEIPVRFHEGKKKLQKVTLPETIGKIGAQAFLYCDVLSEINFPSSLKEIGSNAFNSCPLLSDIQLNEGLEIVDNGAFQRCAGPERLVIPGTVTKVGRWAFAVNSNIKEIEILPSAYGSEIFIGSDAFGVVTVNKLKIGRVVLPRTYNNDPFKDCSPEEIVFGEAWTEIPSSLCYGTTALKAVTLPETVEKIAVGAFSQCNSLTSVNFPASLKEIGRSAFQGCTELSDVVLNEGLEIIGSYAFYGCRGPEKLVIPGTVQIIHEGAFRENVNVKDIEIQTSSDDSEIKIETGAIGVGEFNSLTINKRILQDPNFRTFEACNPENIILGDVWTKIPDLFLYNKDSLKSVTLPETLEKIGVEAFCSCESLSRIDLPASLKEIGNGAFGYCTSLTEFTLNEGLERIGSQAFIDCPGPEKLVLPSTLKEIETCAFYGCSNVNEIEVLPSADGSPLQLDSGAIGCGNVSILKLNRLVESISFSFGVWLSGCSPEEIVFGEAWTDIPNLGFGVNGSLKSLSFPATLEHIGTNTFTGCPAVERVECKAVVPPVCEPDGQWFNAEVYGTAELIIPLGSRGAYEEAVMWKNFTDIKCEGAHLVTAVYDREAGAVTLNGADDARIDVEDGSALEFVITPAEGIRISKATLNERDITAELDAEGRYTVGAVTEPHVLNVEFEKIPTGIESIVGAPNEGTDFSKPFEIYRLDGVRVFKTLGELLPGVYILRQDGKVFKISVK